MVKEKMQALIAHFQAKSGTFSLLVTSNCHPSLLDFFHKSDMIAREQMF